jgi:lysophospholipase L1-like esterase
MVGLRGRVRGGTSRTMWPRARRGMLAFLAGCLAATGSVALVTATAGTAAADGPGSRPYYVSLGDSYSTGYQPGLGSTAGYTATVAQRLDLRLENFGCAGATTTSILDQIGCGGPASSDAAPYPTTTQVAAADAFLRAHRRHVGLVTVSIGGNDITHCRGVPTASVGTCLVAALATVKTNVDTLAADLRAAAGPHVPIIGLTYPDVTLGSWVYPPDSPDQALAELSVTAFQALVNPTLKAAYATVGGGFVDVTAATGAYTPLSDTVTLAPYGTIPVAVAQVCQLTYFCSQGNIHANSTGYALIGRLIADYDQAPPTTAVGVPSVGSTLTGSVWLDASASSPLGIRTTRFVLTGPGTRTRVVATGTPTVVGELAGFDTTTVPNGTYQLRSVVTDDAGVTAESAPVDVVVDNHRLATTVLVPGAGTALHQGSVLDASAVGRAPVTAVRFELRPAGGRRWETVGRGQLTIDGWIALAHLSGVRPGSYELRSVASERGGRRGEVAVSGGVPVSVTGP